jgi:hypothetical protein
MGTLKNWINERIRKHYVDRATKRTYKAATKETLKIFPKGKMSIVNIRTRNNNFLARMIAKFSGGFTHEIAVLHTDRIREILEDDECRILQEKFNYYYKEPPNIEDVRLFVLGSCDDDGINYFDFGKYQNREFSVHVPKPVGPNKVKDMSNLSLLYHGRAYDAIGLIFWPIYNKIRSLSFIFDDEKSYFCSEFVRDIFHASSIRVSKNDNPSPKDVEEFCVEQGWNIYKNY